VRRLVRPGSSAGRSYERTSSVCSVDVDRNPEPLAALPDSYRPLFESLLTVCENDPQVRALWLSGSLARGTADAGSDLDTIIAVCDQDFEDFAAHRKMSRLMRQVRSGGLYEGLL